MKSMRKIELTPEQRAEMDRQRAANPNARGVHVDFTPEQLEEWRQLVREVEAGREQDTAHFRAIQAAERESGFAGDLRRSISAAKVPSDELAERIGVSTRELEDF